MKLRNTVVILFALFAGVAVVVAISLRSEMKNRGVEQVWEQTIADLNDHSSQAHIRTLRYDSYARQAAAEGATSHENLFRALAHSESIHEQMCAKAAKLFGGVYTAPHGGANISTSTDENLKRSLAAVRTHHHLSRGEAATRAIESGNRYVARILIWIDGCNRRHVELLERALSEGCSGRGNSADSVGYMVCPKCGNAYCSDSYDIYCPFCRTYCGEFELFGIAQNLIDDR